MQWHHICISRLDNHERAFDFFFFLGPAFSVTTIGGEAYVKAIGSKYDLIADYRFKVAFEAIYVLWKLTFATSNLTNDVSFRIDQGDWYRWRPPQKVSHGLWTQYYLQVQFSGFCSTFILVWPFLF